MSPKVKLRSHQCFSFSASFDKKSYHKKIILLNIVDFCFMALLNIEYADLHSGLLKGRNKLYTLQSKQFIIRE